MGTDHTGKKAKANNALSVIVRQCFIINHRDLLFDQRMHEFLIIGLLLFGMRKEEISFIRNQVGNRHFFNAQQYITIT
ncbi:hypothetical protein D3C72_638830 [compost metagenome]